MTKGYQFLVVSTVKIKRSSAVRGVGYVDETKYLLTKSGVAQRVRLRLTDLQARLKIRMNQDRCIEQNRGETFTTHNRPPVSYKSLREDY